jgi:site-specific recombinase XerD
MNTEDIIESWLYRKAPGTRDYYSRVARLLLEYCKKPLPELTLLDLQRFATSLESTVPSDNTRRTHLNVVKSLITYTQEKLHLRADNPGRYLEVPKTRDTLVERILSEAEVHLLLASADPQDRPLLTFIYLTGVRASESANLKWRDIDSSFTIANIYGKGSKNRKLPLPPVLVALLGSQWDSPASTDPVFPKHSGKPHTRHSILSAVKRAARAAGLNPSVSTHFLRHSNGTHAAQNGCPAHQIQRQLGHASLTTTSQYLHPQSDQSTTHYLKVQS